MLGIRAVFWMWQTRQSLLQPAAVRRNRAVDGKANLHGYEKLASLAPQALLTEDVPDSAVEPISIQAVSSVSNLREADRDEALVMQIV